MRPLAGANGGVLLRSDLPQRVNLIGVLSTLIYFSQPHTGPLGWIASGGIGFIMVAFGAHFGHTVMGRVSLLIGRIHFLLVDWLRIAS